MTSLLEPLPSEDGNLIGRDPRKITKEEWLASEMPLDVGLRAIRKKCLDCAYTPHEVRCCVQVTCPLWPLRLGIQPKGLRAARDQIEAARERKPLSPALQKAHAARRAQREGDPK